MTSEEVVRIRPYQPSDAETLCAIFVDAVREICRRHYSAEQIEAWGQRKPDTATFHARATDGRLVLVAVDHLGDPLAYVDLEANGHIDQLYCRPDMAGKGIASALYDQIERAARERGIQRLYVEASEAARPLFARKGFVELRRRDFRVADIPIHNFAMEKMV
jgi:putative acetyltransferase